MRYLCSLRKKWKIVAGICLILTAVLLGGCGKKEAGEEFVLDIGNADSVTIYFGENCYSLYSEDMEDVKKCADFFKGLRTEDTSEAMDEKQEFKIYFTGPDGQNALVCVDDNGILWTGESKKFVKIVSGSFDHQGMLDMYLNGMYEDGFDGDMCTIPAK